MVSILRQAAATLILGLACFCLPREVFAQEVHAAPAIQDAASRPAIGSGTEIPDAPKPQIGLLAAIDSQNRPSEGDQRPASGSAPTARGADQGQSAQQPGPDDAQQQKADEQIKQQEKQRIGGILPSFNVSYVDDAASMTARQKIGLAFRSATDPYEFGVAFLVAGIGEAEDEDRGFGWGAKGYFERSGAAYLDIFDGAMISNGFLPAILHQDPRYFRLGHGSFHRRVFHAIASTVVCKHDKSGRWEPNYSNIGGNLIAGAISNLYYPSQDGGGIRTLKTGLVVTGEGAIGNVLQEFWPDISRKVFHKDPTAGRDAKARAADDAENLDKKQRQQKQSQN